MNTKHTEHCGVCGKEWEIEIPEGCNLATTLEQNGWGWYIRANPDKPIFCPDCVQARAERQAEMAERGVGQAKQDAKRQGRYILLFVLTYIPFAMLRLWDRIAHKRDSTN